MLVHDLRDEEVPSARSVPGQLHPVELRRIERIAEGHLPDVLLSAEPAGGDPQVVERNGILEGAHLA